jgi:hypothetical protein
LLDWLGSVDSRVVVAGVLVVLGLVDAILLRAADQRFRRGRLVSR